MAVVILSLAHRVVVLRSLILARLVMALAGTNSMSDKDKPSFNSAMNEMMGEAWGEVKRDFSHGSTLDKTASTAKLIGKGAFFLGVKFVQKLPETVERMNKANQIKKG